MAGLKMWHSLLPQEGVFEPSAVDDFQILPMPSR